MPMWSNLSYLFISAFLSATFKSWMFWTATNVRLLNIRLYLHERKVIFKYSAFFVFDIDLRYRTICMFIWRNFCLTLLSSVLLTSMTTFLYRMTSHHQMESRWMWQCHCNLLHTYRTVLFGSIITVTCRMKNFLLQLFREMSMPRRSQYITMAMIFL